MHIFNIFKNLNEKQREAIEILHCNLLILAGAGSGKTKVLIHRIAWLLSVKNCLPHSIIAVTFTNKAANEIRYRIKNLIDINTNNIWIGTFHGLAHRLLRMHYIEANLPKDFHVIDNDDQLKLLKKIIKSLNINEKKWTAQKAMWFINNKKDLGLRPNKIKIYNNLLTTTWLKIYKTYQEICDRSGLVDFSELLLRAYELWLNQPYILNQYRKRFTNVLIDEFQDTNSIQYAWIYLLANNNSNIMIVGDDDQSIYSWRGAKIENIQRFLQDFPNVITIRLEQNYRSTKNILKSANHLISYNKNRMGKNLWTNKKIGEPISIYSALNEFDEALFVKNNIKTWENKGGKLKDCAILYRNNTQSRVLEDILLQNSISYQIYNGQRFFERKEIKDAIAYLRLISNRNDDAAFERIINTPTRGIGEQTLNIIRKIANENKITLWKATNKILNKNTVTHYIISSLKRFTELINSLESNTTNMPLHIQTHKIIHDSGLFMMYQKEQNENSKTRIENLKELITSTYQFALKINIYNKNLIPLQEFLSYSTLGIIENKQNTTQNSVKLMTLHSAKGLEFPLVFIVGMEEGIFPTKMSWNENIQLEEERRLAYVGITRAMYKLILTYTEVRSLYGKKVYYQPSRFINELPKECIKKIKKINILSNQIQCNYLNKEINNNYYNYYKIGQYIQHPTFGKGIIINLIGDGKNIKLQIKFSKNNIKWLVAIYSNIKKI
ncbi:DNA helicase II [Serratia symbiotica]|nr:DNA helicase II [Serratia symbiotica]